MGNTDISLQKIAYPLTQSGEEIQRILNVASILSDEKIQQLYDLIDSIETYDSDNGSLGDQFRKILNDAVMENEIQNTVNENTTYPPTSKAVYDSINEVRTALDSESEERRDVCSGIVQIVDTNYAEVLNEFTNIHSDITELSGDNETMQSNIDTINTVIEAIGGTWHGGTELTHTSGFIEYIIEDKAKQGDFYLNTEHGYVYHTDNGTHWKYTGNLNGSVDTTQWAGIDSPKFIGEPKAPTPLVSNNSNQIATTEYVRNAIDTYSDKSGTTGIKTFKLSECPRWLGYDKTYSTPDVAIGQIFLLKNDTNESFNYFTQHDEYGNDLSEPIPAGETRVCVVTDWCYGGAEVHNGYVWVLPVGGASISSLSSEVIALKNRVKALEEHNS